MNIETHPFRVLGINARCSKGEILQRAESLAVTSHSDIVNECRFQVTHPAKRVAAEVSWFPGVSPARLRQLVDMLYQDSSLPIRMDEKLRGFDGLGKFNALTYWVGLQKEVSPPTWVLALRHLSRHADAVHADVLLGTLNADRSAAGFPQITDSVLLQNTLAGHLDAAAAFMAERLASTSRHAEVLATVVGECPVIRRK